MENCVALNLPSVDGEITVQYNKLELLQNLTVLEVYSTLHHSSSLSSHNEEVFICVGTSTDSCKSQRSSMFQNIISQLLNGKFDLVSALLFVCCPPHMYTILRYFKLSQYNLANFLQ